MTELKLTIPLRVTATQYESEQRWPSDRGMIIVRAGQWLLHGNGYSRIMQDEEFQSLPKLDPVDEIGGKP